MDLVLLGLSQRMLYNQLQLSLHTCPALDSLLLKGGLSALDNSRVSPDKMRWHHYAASKC